MLFLIPIHKASKLSVPLAFPFYQTFLIIFESQFQQCANVKKNLVHKCGACIFCAYATAATCSFSSVRLGSQFRPSWSALDCWPQWATGRVNGQEVKIKKSNVKKSNALKPKTKSQNSQKSNVIKWNTHKVKCKRSKKRKIKCKMSNW